MTTHTPEPDYVTLAMDIQRGWKHDLTGETAYIAEALASRADEFDVHPGHIFRPSWLENQRRNYSLLPESKKAEWAVPKNAPGA